MAASALGVGFEVSLAKIKPPARTSTMVERGEAFEALLDCLESRVVIIEAPFGFAKSSLLAEAYYRLGEEGSRWGVAWLSVDEQDDAERLFRHVLASLATLYPDLDTAAFMNLYRDERRSSAVALSNFLLERAVEGREVAVLVDDLHKADPVAVSELLNITARFLPEGVHVVATGNHSLWEAVDVEMQEHVRIFPAEKLCFTVHEIEQMLEGVEHRRKTNVSGLFDDDPPALSREERSELAQNLWTATEGWPLALKLYADALARGSVEYASAVDERSLGKALKRYFRLDVFDHLPADVQDVLVIASLPDEICPDLCDVLTGRSDSKFVLRDLYLSGAFVSPVAGNPGWYRIHPLPLRWLRSKLSQYDDERFVGLCLSASDWFETRGMALEAAKCLFLASDTDFVEGLSSALGYEASHAGMNYEEWSIRVPARAFASDPQLALQAAWCYLLKGRMDDGWRWIESFERIALETGLGEPDAVSLAVALAHEKCLEFDCRYAEAVAEGEALLEAHSGRLSIQQSCLLLHSLGDSYFHCGRFDDALKCYLKAEVMADLGSSDLFLVLSQSSTIRLYWHQGKVKDALALCDRALQQKASTVFVASVLALKTRLCVETGDLDEARWCVEEASRFVSPSFNSDVLFEVEAERARYLDALGQGAQAFRLVAKAAYRIGGGRLPRSIDFLVREVQADVTLSMGYVPEAQAAVRDLRASVGDGDAALDLACCVMEARVADAAGEGGTAADLLPLIDRACALGMVMSEMELSIRAADRFAREGLHADAIMYVTRALKLQAGQHIVGPFLRAGGRIRGLLHEIVDVRKSAGQVHQLAKTVLRSFGEGESERGAQPPEAAPAARFGLTDREREVLDLLDAGLSRREIAEALSVSLNTVKTHVSHIYEKLGVTNRVDAFLAVHDE